MLCSGNSLMSLKALGVHINSEIANLIYDMITGDNVFNHKLK